MENKKLTRTQQKSLHLWLHQKAQQCREAGVTAQMAFAETIELEMSDEMMKEVWRQVQKVLFKKSSTTELNKAGEIDEIYEHLNRFFAKAPFFLDGIDFPNNEQKHLEDLAPVHSEIDYPENKLGEPIL